MNVNVLKLSGKNVSLESVKNLLRDCGVKLQNTVFGYVSSFTEGRNKKFQTVLVIKGGNGSLFTQIEFPPVFKHGLKGQDTLISNLLSECTLENWHGILNAEPKFFYCIENMEHLAHTKKTRNMLRSHARKVRIGMDEEGQVLFQGNPLTRFSLNEYDQKSFSVNVLGVVKNYAESRRAA